MKKKPLPREVDTLVVLFAEISNRVKRRVIGYL